MIKIYLHVVANDDRPCETVLASVTIVVRVIVVV
jgi:hypothetical protein